MITYDSGRWGLAFALRLHGSVFPRAFCWSFPAAVLTSILHSILQDHDSLAVGSVGVTALSGFTFILGFLIVFRSQQAWSRWWEGATLLQQLRGEWFNAFSSLMAFCNSKEDMRAEVREFQHRLVRLVSLLYAAALEEVTTVHKPNLELLTLDGFELEGFAFMQGSHDKCEVVLQWIQRMIVEADTSQVIKVAPPILARVYQQLGQGIVNLNNARKINDFPIPFPLAQMVTFMLLCHFGITILVCAASVETASWAGFLTFLVIFSFWCINYIAIELEMPFGDDPNDLPLPEMQADLNKSLIHLMQPLAQTCPSFKYNDSHSLCHTTSTHLDEYLAQLKPEMFSPDGSPRMGRDKSFSEVGKKISRRMLQARMYTDQLQFSRRPSQQKKPKDESESSIDAVEASACNEDISSVPASPPEGSSPTLPPVSPKPVQTGSVTEGEVESFPTSQQNVVLEVFPENMPAPGQLESQATPSVEAGQNIASALPPIDYSGVDVIWLSKRLEDHLCQIVRELQASRQKDAELLRCSPLRICSSQASI